MDQVLALSSEGFEIVVLALGDAVNTANHTGLPMAPLTAPTAAAYGEMLKAAQIDLVLAHHSVFGAEAAADLGIPFVQLLEDARARPCADELVEWRAAEDATAAYLALSNRMAQVAHLGLGLCPAKTVVLKAETETLARVLMWLQDGGHPSAARPFAW